MKIVFFHEKLPRNEYNLRQYEEEKRSSTFGEITFF